MAGRVQGRLQRVPPSSPTAAAPPANRPRS